MSSTLNGYQLPVIKISLRIVSVLSKSPTVQSQNRVVSFLACDFLVVVKIACY